MEMWFHYAIISTHLNPSNNFINENTERGLTSSPIADSSKLSASGKWKPSSLLLVKALSSTLSNSLSLWTCSACSSTRSRTLALFCLWVPFWSGIDHGSGPALLSYCSYSNITHRGKLTILLISKCEIKKQVEKSNYKYIFIRAINWDKYR